jgi:integrase
VIAGARARSAALGLYLWLVVVTGVRRGELCGLQLRDIDLDRGLVHAAFNYVVRGGQRVRKDTKTHHAMLSSMQGSFPPAQPLLVMAAWAVVSGFAAVKPFRWE